ncbi:hypothetical protein [Belnapia sp. F-4-1]|uniref:hypothetical protein n=1 Tax=Belnapia sp. F-4-1 TaxID=1545443 RepID=UPI0005BA8CB8|nr:hypothetical protein [Belnapia sp. F-4-1]
MRYSEIRARPATTDTHPFVTDITIAPATFEVFERAMEDRRDVCLLAWIDRDDRYLVHLGCSSAAVRRTIQTALG